MQSLQSSSSSDDDLFWGNELDNPFNTTPQIPYKAPQTPLNGTNNANLFSSINPFTGIDEMHNTFNAQPDHHYNINPTPPIELVMGMPTTLTHTQISDFMQSIAKFNQESEIQDFTPIQAFLNRAMSSLETQTESHSSSTSDIDDQVD